MDIAAAEKVLTRQVAQWSGLEADRTVLCGSGAPGAAPLVSVRFVSGKTAAAALAEFVAMVRGAFAEPEEARAFAAAVWGELPRYGIAGFAELAPEGSVEFAESDGLFTAAGRIRVRFAYDMEG